MSATDQELYSQALQLQGAGHILEAIKFWNEFLKNNPRSFEARNNLGLAYYANDQIPQAISEFETALSIEPNDGVVKNNLRNALQFQATLDADNHEYDEAINKLNRATELSNAKDKEKLGFQIEMLQDQIFMEAKNVNTLEAYEDFLERFPDSPGNSDEARAKIKELKAESGAPAMPDPLTAADPVSSEPVMETMPEQLTAVDPAMPDMMAEEIPALSDLMAAEEPELTEPEPVMEPEPIPAMPDAMAASEPAPAAPVVPEPMTSPGPAPAPVIEKQKWVVVTTKSSPLLIRDRPSREGKILSKAPKGSKYPHVKEEKEWFQIEYGKNKKGWVSRKFSKVME
ncbi:MAG: tetratricopeptide repeat protein [Candidatus Nitrohelix vancouverensis]|uniref:Tetratricopeptide repeat protein n=1 Tax=Candidatus Nitrohelix vancouverensis TaxID=2705534 RepID=A0A7T0BZW7_9BACT|nr:MAG: tetratricopeptide repeat protein [Candidatus Nitrohelix vancouverensis]